MTNLLTNGGFEGGAWRQTFNGSEYGEISVPIGWTAFWDVGLGRPEMKVIGAVAPYLDPPRVPEGKQAVQWFTFYRTHDAGLYQRVSLPAGCTLRLSALAHVWYSQRDDAHKSEYHYASAPDVWYQFTEADPGMQVMLGIDPTGGVDWQAAAVHWTIENYYDQPWEIALEVEDCGAAVTVFLRTITAWPYKHCDAYWDDVRLEIVAEPEPDPLDCPGRPRCDYARTVNVIPGNATAERAETIFAQCWANGRQTVTGSYDDAGIGDLSEKTAVLWDIDAVDQPDYVEFYEQYYPGTRVVFQGESESLPPAGGEPLALPAPASLIGLHMQNPKSGWLDYYRKVKPGVYKALQLGMCLEVRDASPDTLVVYRHHVNNDGSWLYRSAGVFHSSAGLRASALGFLDLYSSDFALHAQNAGMTLAQILDRLDVIESINEVIGNHDPELEPAVEFDCYFAEAIEERYGNALKAGMLTIPVGNPHESEFAKLLPAARVAANGNHYLAYHGYWGANATTSYLASTWPQIAGRWAEWDAVFRAHGVYPRYYLGESGICHSEDGWNLNNVLGWKGCGPFSKYITDLEHFDRLGRQWNALHGGRLRGMTIFCYGGNDWPGYEFEPGDLAELGQALA